jgi:hypothetical protein
VCWSLVYLFGAVYISFVVNEIHNVQNCICTKKRKMFSPRAQGRAEPLLQMFLLTKNEPVFTKNGYFVA